MGSKSQNLILCGFMGTGKSSTGKALAELWGWDYVDTDKQIEAEQQRTIVDIFAKDGEAAFRLLETDCLRRVLKKEKQVIAVGGGMVLAQENMKLMDACATPVRLCATVDTIWQRISRDTHRPLVRAGNKAAIEELLKQREPYYARIVWQINTDGLSPKAVAEEIDKQWKNKQV